MDDLPRVLLLEVGRCLAHRDLASVRAVSRALFAVDWGAAVQAQDVGCLAEMAPERWQRMKRTVGRVETLRLELHRASGAHAYQWCDLACFTRVRSLTLAWAGHAPSRPSQVHALERRLDQLLRSGLLARIEHLHVPRLPPATHAIVSRWLHATLASGGCTRLAALDWDGNQAPHVPESLRALRCKHALLHQVSPTLEVLWCRVLTVSELVPPLPRLRILGHHAVFARKRHGLHACLAAMAVSAQRWQLFDGGKAPVLFPAVDLQHSSLNSHLADWDACVAEYVPTMLPLHARTAHENHAWLLNAPLAVVV